ncbi:hypothetical protein BJV78DRAFT_823637 [Lactifluus subvellereus]|nr:hypothetical protein BJV78DRAFT_823637 [Lactifluus subvellereus]
MDVLPHQRHLQSSSERQLHLSSHHCVRHRIHFSAAVLVPLIQWTLHKKFRMKFLKYLNFPVLFSGLAYMPPATPIHYVPWVFIYFLFNYVIRRRHTLWWLKYNFLCT